MLQRPFSPLVLVLDDGELDDVRELLRELDVDFADARGAPPDPGQHPEALLVTTARHALAGEALPGAGRAVLIAVAEQGSKRLLSALERSGVDFVVRRPVHPTAFRLLVRSALHRGPERRRAARVAIGAPVKWRAGLRWHPATLIELSLEGCRLQLARPVDSGRALKVWLPRELVGERSLSLAGRVVRVRVGDVGTPGCTIAVGFDGVDPGARRRLRKVLMEHGRGPAVLREAAPAPRPVTRPPVQAPVQASDDGPQAGWRRLSGVALAETPDGSAVLVGRDLSESGMRVEPHPALRVGEPLSLVLYGEAGAPGLRLDAAVTREDGSDVVALRFGDLDASDAARLRELLASPPVLESAPVAEPADAPDTPAAPDPEPDAPRA